MKIEQKRQSIILRVIKRLSYRKLKIGDKFKENETLIAQVINIRKEKYGTWIYYKMIDGKLHSFMAEYQIYTHDK